LNEFQQKTIIQNQIFKQISTNPLLKIKSLEGRAAHLARGQGAGDHHFL